MDRLVTEAQEGGTEYAEAVCKETLRMRPVLPIVARLLKRDVEIGGQLLPEGVIVAPNIYLVQHRADVYPEPAALPARALPRGPGRHVQLDPVRRRHPPLHRRQLRALRDADRAAGDRQRAWSCAPRSRRPSRSARRSITLTPRFGAEVVAA